MTASIVAAVQLQTAGVEKGVAAVSSKMRGMASATGSVFKGVLGANVVGKALEVAGAGVEKFTGLLGDSVDEARESQKVGATTAQIIKATGGAAKISADQVGDLAESISNKTGKDDEAVQSGANLLLTFKNVKNEAGAGAKIFDRATAAAVDLSAAGFGSIEGSSKMLGKALNDPVKGISALGRAGVTFTEDQKKTIKEMVRTGDVLGAQKMIMQEVESQVGGVAAANATAGEKAAVMAGNLKEQFGTALLPLLDKAAGFFTSTLGPAISAGIEDMAPLLDGLGKALPAALSAAGRVVGPVVSGLSGLAKLVVGGDFTKSLREAFGWAEDSSMVDTILTIRESLLGVFSKLPGLLAQVPGLLAPIKEGFETAFGAVGRIVSTIVPQIMAVISAVVGIVQQNLPAIRAALGSVFGGIGAVVQAVAPIVQQVFSTIVGAVQSALPQLQTAFSSVVSIVSSVGSILSSVAALVTRVWTAIAPVVLPIIKTVFGTIVSVVSGALNIVAGLFKTIAAVLKGDWSGAWNGIKQIVSGAWTIIKAVVGGALSVLKTVIGAALGVIKGIWSGAWNGTKQIASAAWGVIKAVVSAGASAVKGFVLSSINSAKSAMSAGWNAIKSAVSTAWSRIKSTVSTGVSNVVTTVRGLPGKAKSALGNIASLLVGAGRDMVRGFVDGIGQGISWVTDKARSIARAAVDAAKNALGIHSPSKVFKQIGKFVGDGFAQGLQGTEARVQSTVTKMVGLLRREAQEKGKAGARAKKALQTVYKLDDRALAVARARTVVTEKLSAAQEKLNELVKQRADYQASVTDSARQYASITSVGSLDEKPQTTANIITGLTERLAAVKNYTSKLSALWKRGLNKDTYDQLVQAGVETGTDYVDALFSGDDSAIAQVNSLQASITSATATLGNQTADAMFKAGIQAQEGLLAGLVKDKAALEKTAAALAAALTAAVKKALKIKSPSRVFRGIGEQTVAGLAIGLDDRKVAVQGRRMASALTDGFGSPALSGSAAGGGSVTHLNVTLQVQPGVTGAQVGADFVRFVREYERTSGRKVLAS